MKLTRTLLVALLLCCVSLIQAQSPPPGNLSGSSLRNWLKSNWYDGQHNQLGYTNARRKMYNFIDNQNNKIEDVYSGYLKTWTYGGSGTNPSPINCEHTVPQSLFGSSEPMRSDLHHLFPAHSSPNNSRASWPFGEISDPQTTKWWKNGSSQTSIPSSGIDAYSEYKYGFFEPRESHKGNAARAVFYFYTMYPSQAGSISNLGDINTLYQWHLQDPVDASERSRNDRIETYQGDRNPYVDYPELVARAWGFATSSGGLLISEYVEGSSNNKAIELTNLSGSAINLGQYSLRKQVNGSGGWDSGVSLSGSLPSGGVYVVAYSSASSAIQGVADLSTSSSTLAFNGNDPIGLFQNGSLIDIVGTFNGGSSNFAVNVTLRRKSSISQPSSSYSASEWDSYGQDNIANLGSYGGSKMQDIPAAATLLVSPNPFSDRIKIEAELDMSGQVQLELLDLNGRVLLRNAIAPGETLELETSELPAGMYILRQDTGGNSHCSRLWKRQ